MVPHTTFMLVETNQERRRRRPPVRSRLRPRIRRILRIQRIQRIQRGVRSSGRSRCDVGHPGHPAASGRTPPRPRCAGGRAVAVRPSTARAGVPRTTRRRPPPPPPPPPVRPEVDLGQVPYQPGRDLAAQRAHLDLDRARKVTGHRPCRHHDDAARRVGEQRLYLCRNRDVVEEDHDRPLAGQRTEQPAHLAGALGMSAGSSPSARRKPPSTSPAVRGPPSSTSAYRCGPSISAASDRSQRFGRHPERRSTTRAAPTSSPGRKRSTSSGSVP